MNQEMEMAYAEPKLPELPQEQVMYREMSSYRQFSKPEQVVLVYHDKENDVYYIDYSAFEVLAFTFTVNDVPVYDLGNNTYKGDLQKQSVTVGGKSGLLKISHVTLDEISKYYKVEFATLQVEKKNDMDDLYNSYLDNLTDKGSTNIDDKKVVEDYVLDNPLLNVLEPSVPQDSVPQPTPMDSSGFIPEPPDLSKYMGDMNLTEKVAGDLDNSGGMKL